MSSFDFGGISAYKFGLAVDTSANVNSVAIDTAGFEGVAIVGVSGDGTLSSTNKFSFSFVESDDTNISNASAVAEADALAIVATNSAVWASVRPIKRYVFAQLVAEGSASANIAVLGALGYPHNAPTQ